MEHISFSSHSTLCELSLWQMSASEWLSSIQTQDSDDEKMNTDPVNMEIQLLP